MSPAHARLVVPMLPMQPEPRGDEGARTRTESSVELSTVAYERVHTVGRRFLLVDIAAAP